MKIDFFANIFLTVFLITFIGVFLFIIITVIKIFVGGKKSSKAMQKELEEENKKIQEGSSIFARALSIMMAILCFSFFVMWFSPFFEENSNNSLKLVILMFGITILATTLIKPIKNYMIKRKIKLNR